MSRYYMGPLDRASWLRHLQAKIDALQSDRSCLFMTDSEGIRAIYAAIAETEGRLAALEEYDIYCLPEDILARINADPRRI